MSEAKTFRGKAKKRGERRRRDEALSQERLVAKYVAMAGAGHTPPSTPCLRGGQLAGSTGSAETLMTQQAISGILVRAEVP